MDDAETFSTATLAAPHPLAAAAGRDVLIEGGTVVEAALAAVMVSAVVTPDRVGLGGDALWMIREPGPRGRVRVLDARGTVAAAARLSFYRERDREAVPPHGPEAVLAAPGAVAGWMEVQALSAATGGRLPVARSRDGWDLFADEAAALARAAPALSAVPGFAGAFLVDGEAPKTGDRRRAPALAATLDYLAGAGLDDIFTGDVARELAADLEALSCPLARTDLKRTEVRWREPQALDLARHALAVPPIRAGLCAAVALGLADGLAAVGFDVTKADGVGRWHGLIEASRAAEDVIARAEAAGRDPRDLFDPARLARFVLTLDPARACPASPPSPPILTEAAAWIGVVDRDGAAVSVVHTLGSAFGSGVVSRRTGILMGNRGAALALDPDVGPILRPGRRVPLASLPAMLSDARGGRVAALGASTAETIVQLADRIVRGMPAGEALAALRFALGATPDGRDAAVLVAASREPGPWGPLRAAGHVVIETDAADGPAGIALRDGAGRVAAATDSGDVAGL